MPCPFPGMDPYIERLEIWPDFQLALTVHTACEIRKQLRTRYTALVQHREYQIESDAPVLPARLVVRPSIEASNSMAAVEAPVVFGFCREDVCERYIEIIEPAAENRVISTISVLSPANKQSGVGCDSYVRQREEFWDAGTNLVEIDLLREGEPTVRVSTAKLATLRPWHYLVSVTRRWPSRQEVYPIPVQRRLPNVAIPLGANDNDVTLDLQAAFSRCWNEGPYPEILRYDGLPPGQMAADETRWCEDLLRGSGFRV